MIILWCYRPFPAPLPTLVDTLHWNLNKHLMAGCEIPHQLSVLVFLRALQWLPVTVAVMDYMPVKNIVLLQKNEISLSLGYVLFNHSGNKVKL